MTKQEREQMISKGKSAIAAEGKGKPVAAPVAETVKAQTVNGKASTDATAELKAELERLRAENEALKAGNTRATRVVFTAKGGVSIFCGNQRNPANLRYEHVLYLLDNIDTWSAEWRAKLPELKDSADWWRGLTKAEQEAYDAAVAAEREAKRSAKASGTRVDMTH